MKAEFKAIKEVLQGVNVFYDLTFRVSNPVDVPNICELTIAKFSGERNKDQNGKYWTIVKEIARKISSSAAEVHNQLLRDYGAFKLDENGEPCKVFLRENYPFETDEDLHLMPTDIVISQDGLKLRVFYQLLNSSQMTKAQFSKLIEGAEYELEEINE